MTVLFLAVLVAAIAAAVFFFRWRSASSSALALRGEVDALRGEVDAARSEQRRLNEELRQKRELLADTREKLTDTRKKAQDTRVQKQQSRSSREAELEEDLRAARRLAEEAHAAEAAARHERDEARALGQRTQAELQKAQEKLRPMPTPAPAPAQVTPPPPDFVEARKELEAKLSGLQRELDEARGALKEAKKKEQDLREDVRRYRGRAETNNRVYLVTRGELDVTKERLAQAERKLWQAGIPIAPPEKKERPRATGPASADRPRSAEEATTSVATAAAEPSHPPPAASEMPTVASVPAPESIPTPAQQPGPQAVPPIRRRADGSAEPE